MTSCTLPRPVTITDTPHPQVDTAMASQRHDITSLDLDGCNIVYVTMAMNEFERPLLKGLRFDQWPETIQARMAKEIDAWQERNPAALIMGVTQGVRLGCCVIGLHWRPKA
jgi:hypothetical protein